MIHIQDYLFKYSDKGPLPLAEQRFIAPEATLQPYNPDPNPNSTLTRWTWSGIASALRKYLSYFMHIARNYDGQPSDTGQPIDDGQI